MRQLKWCLVCGTKGPQKATCTWFQRNRKPIWKKDPQLRPSLMLLQSKLSAELAGILMPQHGSRKDPKSVSAQRAKLRLAGVNAATVPR